ncbi:MAG: hypothetical protein WC285_00745 [Candidatus Gracilibacteria bacterium]
MNSNCRFAFGILACYSVFLTACNGVFVSVPEQVVWEKTKLYEIKNCTLDGSCFFQYPSTADFSEKDNVATISSKTCDVYFGLAGLEKKITYEVKTAGSGDQSRDSWWNGDVMAGYVIGFPKTDYKFWVYEDGDSISECVSFVDQIADSFTTKPVYYNEKFAFRTSVLPGFRVEYLQNDEGIVMRRTVSGEELKKIVDAEWAHWPKGTKTLPDENPYDVEIGITAMENLLGYEDLGAYLKAECADCTVEFTKNGVFVNEDKLNFAERVYLVMSDDKNIIYRAYLRLPRYRYKYHEKGFSEWVKTIEF